MVLSSISSATCATTTITSFTDGDYRVEMLADGKLRFTHPRGWVIPEVPTPAEPPDEPLTDIELDGSEGKAQWGGEPINVAYVIDTTWRSRSSPE